MSDEEENPYATERFMFTEAAGLAIQCIGSMFGAIAQSCGVLGSDLYHEACRRRLLLDDRDRRRAAGYELERIVEGP